MPKRQNQSYHDQMVKYVHDFLVQKGYQNVRVDLNLPGYTPPTKITWTATGQGHIPDVTALSDQFNLVEVETADSIFDNHTADQWKLFSSHASNNNYIFWAVVPVGSEADANKRLANLGIQAKVWEVQA